MASGWAGDDAVHEQIESSVAEAVEHARSRLPAGESRSHCLECEALIPEARRRAIPGVQLCVACQSEADARDRQVGHYNRRGSKDSQLR
ncbi:DksA/TraR family C4-type zinc finger protein [Aquisalimonas lutea]|uniref:DksA/TraR family C4-type zinc finger protein n=1 Tax=Aquisalimonas lutea TaxID=1327750 RepID=UPI0025B4CCC5|nr:DksA/TraR family C4-type zinc finger protein [Aquisalimonas lutea]MDN3516934.1 DksA/TraR family C4-type zinc finger protein [Aquisalimonas lutea]